MDKKTVLLASACTLLMISCSNDAELINVAETTGLQTKAFVGEADFQIVDYAGYNVFSSRMIPSLMRCFGR